MRTLTASLRADHVVGERIELPWAKLNRELSLHTKELVLIAGAPSSGKSVFATNLAMHLSEPVLYISQDSSPSIIARLAALATHRTIADMFDDLRDTERAQELATELEGQRPLLAVQTGAQTLEGISLLVEAAEEWLGLPPPVVILDNLINTVVDGYHYHDTGFYATALPHFQILAEQKNLCFIALHHVTRRGGNSGKQLLPTQPLNMMDLLYAGERPAEHVLGVHHDQNKTKLFIQLLKQRDGAADSEGGHKVPLLWAPPMGRLTSWNW